MSPLSGSRGHSSVTLIFLPTPPRKPSSESYSSSIGLWITNSISLGSNPNIFKWFIGLWLSYLSPIFSGHLHEYDAEISSYQHALSLLPRSAPTHASDVYYLAMLRLNRYALSELKQQDDLEQSIIGFTEAILSLPLPQDSPFQFPNINLAFRSLTATISLLAKKSRHPKDVECSTIYIRYLRGLLHDIHIPFSFPVTANLVSSLVLKVELELGDVDENIEEMADLCDKLLDSDISTDSLTRSIMHFVETVDDYVIQPFGMRNPSEKVISCLQKAIIRLPDLPQVSIMLAKYLFCCFEKTVLDNDYNKGMAILDKVISFCGPGDTPSPYQEQALQPTITFSFVRFFMSGKPEHLEQAIYLNRTLLDWLSLEDPDHAIIP